MARITTRIKVPYKVGAYPMTTLSSARIWCTTPARVLLTTFSRAIILRFFVLGFGHLPSFLKHLNFVHPWAKTPFDSYDGICIT